MFALLVTAFGVYQAIQPVLGGPAADPLITPGPLIRRDDTNDPHLLGYYFNTDYSQWLRDRCTTSVGDVTFTSSGGYYRCCSTGVSCAMPTGCVGSVVYLPGTSATCSVGRWCTSDVMFASQGATAAQVYVYCASIGVQGTTYFRQNPTASPTSTSPSTSTSSHAATSSVAPVNKSPVGAIVGGVVGGLAVLAFLAFGIFCLLRRKRRATVEPSNPVQPELLKTDPAPSSPPPQTSQIQYSETGKPSVVEQVSPGPAVIPPPTQYPIPYPPPTGQYPQQMPFGAAVPQYQQQYPQYYPPEGPRQNLASAAPQAVEMDSPQGSPPPHYGNFNPNPQ